MHLINLILFTLCTVMSAKSYEYSELRCVVCKAVIKEMHKEVQKESSTKTVDVGGYSMDPDGNVKKKRKLLVQSEMYISEVMDKVCDKMSDYIRATDKLTGKLVLVNLLDMGSSPGLGDVDIIQDSDLNKSLEHQCKAINEEFEDDVLEVFTAGSATPVEDVCDKRTDLCPRDSQPHYEL